MYLTHPLRVTVCQVIVYGNDMDALSLQGIQVCRQRRHQRLTFTCFHLSDTSLVKDDAADQLHPVMLHIQYTSCGLPHGSKCLRQQVV